MLMPAVQPVERGSDSDGLYAVTVIGNITGLSPSAPFPHLRRTDHEGEVYKSHDSENPTFSEGIKFRI